MKEDSVFFDTTDLRILSILQNNAREPISQIARQVNLSGTAVLRRIHRMDVGTVRRNFIMYRGFAQLRSFDLQWIS